MLRRSVVVVVGVVAEGRGLLLLEKVELEERR